MYKVTLLLHFYRKHFFISQKLYCLELPAQNDLHRFIDLLGRGFRDFNPAILSNYPTLTKEHLKILEELRCIYGDLYGYSNQKDQTIESADNVRVMQVIDGWPIEPPILRQFV